MSEKNKELNTRTYTDSGDPIFPFNSYILHNSNELNEFLSNTLNMKHSTINSSLSTIDKSYDLLYSILSKFKVLTVVVEDNYVDKIYRDSYYMYYSKKNRQYSRYCKRLLMFYGEYDLDNIISIDDKKLSESFIGSIVIRPLLQGVVGRTLLNPKYFFNGCDYFIRTTLYTVTFLNKRIEIEAFPYSMQDGETMSCAETTLINMLDYFGIEYPDYKQLLPSEIINIVEQNDYQRKLPSIGLKFQEMSKVFSLAGFQPILYQANQLKDEWMLKRLIYYYMESGIPVALGLKDRNSFKHAIICIGHTQTDKNAICNKKYCYRNRKDNINIWVSDTSDVCDDYIVINDNIAPYSRYKWVENTTAIETNLRLDKFIPECALVPLYKHMYMDAQSAYDICTAILSDKKLGITGLNLNNTGKNYNLINLATRDNPVVIRLFMASSKNFKRKRIQYFYEQQSRLSKYYSGLQCSKFVWVCELYTSESYCTSSAPIGEIILDATASDITGINSGIIAINYPHKFMYYEDSSTGVSHYSRIKTLHIEEWTPLCTYTNNLKNDN